MLSKFSKSISFYKISKRFLKDYDPTKDYYKVLGLTKQSTDKEIKTTYYKLAKQYHPDVNQGKTSEKFKEMSAAYDILSDPIKRREYDASRSINSFFTGKQYSSTSNTNTNSSSYQYNDYRTYEDPFKNMNDFFRNFYQKNQQQQNYKNNFNEKSKDFRSKFYSKNKDYFSSFKIKEEKTYQEDPPKNTSGKTNFSKKYFDNNKKYYETFKKPNEDNNNRYNSNTYEETVYTNQSTNSSQSGALYFILTFFGIFLGSILVHSIFGTKTPRQSYQQPKPLPQSYEHSNVSSEYVYQDPYSNKKLN
jgi:curved DNA-binding protein CbpA